MGKRIPGYSVRLLRELFKFVSVGWLCDVLVFNLMRNDELLGHLTGNDKTHDYEKSKSKK